MPSYFSLPHVQAGGKLGPQLDEEDELSALLSDSAALMASRATTSICGCSCGSLAISLLAGADAVADADAVAPARLYGCN